jgi:hypothetical protein
MEEIHRTRYKIADKKLPCLVHSLHMLSGKPFKVCLLKILWRLHGKA